MDGLARRRGERLETPYAQSVLAPGCEFWSAELMAAECRQVRDVSAGSVHTIWWDGSPEDRHRVR